MSFRHLIVVSVVAATGMAAPAFAGSGSFVSETVYVEVPFDTDGDGRMDRIYVSIDREAGGTNLPVILTMSPYALGGNDVPNHEVDVRRSRIGVVVTATDYDYTVRPDAGTELALTLGQASYVELGLSTP